MGPCLGSKSSICTTNVQQIEYLRRNIGEPPSESPSRTGPCAQWWRSPQDQTMRTYHFHPVAPMLWKPFDPLGPRIRSAVHKLIVFRCCFLPFSVAGAESTACLQPSRRRIFHWLVVGHVNPSICSRFPSICSEDTLQAPCKNQLIS
jgi:hypothetical protein